MHAHAAQAFAENAGQVQHLFTGALAGIGKGIEVHRVHAHAALGDHPARHRAVDAAGEQQRGLAVRPHRHPAYRGNGMGIEVGQVANLHREHDIGVFHVHLEPRQMLQQICAHFHVDGGRVHGIALVAAAGVDLEGAPAALHELCRLGAEGLKIILFHLGGPAHAVHAEHLGHAADGLVHIGRIADIDAAVAQPHMAADRLDRVADAVHQHT